MFHVIGPDGNLYGPADIPMLCRWCAEGRIVPTTELVDQRLNRRFYANQLPELQAVFMSGSPQISQAFNPHAMPMNMQFNGYLQPYSPPKSKATALVLAFFLGSFGIHRFYLGHTGVGLTLLVLTVLSPCTGFVTLAIAGLWSTIDLILIACNQMPDSNGQNPI